MRIFSNFEHNINGHFFNSKMLDYFENKVNRVLMGVTCRPPLISEIVGKFDLGLQILRF